MKTYYNNAPYIHLANQDEGICYNDDGICDTRLCSIVVVRGIGCAIAGIMLLLNSMGKKL